MTIQSWSPVCAAVVAGALIFAPAAAGQDADADVPVIPAGVDVFATPDDGQTRLVDLYIPAGYFCAQSPQQVVDIPLKGQRLATSPAGALGTADTVIYRTEDAILDGGSATVPIEVVGLSLVGSAPFQVPECGQSFNVEVCAASTQPQGSTITISLDSQGNGGTFDAALDVAGVVTFESGGAPVGVPLSDTIFLTTTGGAWADQVGGNGVDHSGRVQVDLDCSGTPNNPSFPGTSGFHPGWSWNPPPGYGCPNPPCHVPVPEVGPHVTVVPRPWSSTCPSPSELEVVLSSESAESTSSSLQFDAVEPCEVEVSDALVTRSGGADCTSTSLRVLENGVDRGFKVVSSDPCVLEL